MPTQKNQLASVSNLGPRASLVNISQSVRESSTMVRGRNNSMAVGGAETVNMHENPLHDSVTGLNLANPNLDLNEDDGEENKSAIQRSQNTPFALHKNASIGSLNSHMTLNQTKKRAKGQSPILVMQESIEQALSKWKFDEVIQEAMLKHKQKGDESELSTDKLRGIGQLMRFARSPSSAQVIFEQKSTKPQQ